MIEEVADRGTSRHFRLLCQICFELDTVEWQFDQIQLWCLSGLKEQTAQSREVKESNIQLKTSQWGASFAARWALLIWECRNKVQRKGGTLRLLLIIINLTVDYNCEGTHEEIMLLYLQFL